MKLIRTRFVAVLLLGTAAATIAAPPGKRVFPALRTTEDFQSLKTGDKVALVCKQCDTVTVQTVENTEDETKLCNDGKHVVCGSCKVTAKVVRRGPRGKSGAQTEVRYEDEKGEKCMFVARIES